MNELSRPNPYGSRMFQEIARQTKDVSNLDVEKQRKAISDERKKSSIIAIKMRITELEGLLSSAKEALAELEPAKKKVPKRKIPAKVAKVVKAKPRAVEPDSAKWVEARRANDPRVPVVDEDGGDQLVHMKKRPEAP